MRLVVFGGVIGSTAYGLNIFSEKYTLSSNVYSKMKKKFIMNDTNVLSQMQRKFDKYMAFTKVNKDDTKVTEIDGLQLIAFNKPMIVYFGYPDCNDSCQKQLLKLNENMKQVYQNNHRKRWPLLVYIDLNIFDNNKKLANYIENIFGENDESVVGLIPKDRKCLRDLIESFSLYVEKSDSDTNLEHLKLNHSNLIYFVDHNGIIQNCLSHESSLDEIYQTTQEIIQSSTVSADIAQKLNQIMWTKSEPHVKQVNDAYIKKYSF